jgi:hypothetical protein
MRTGGADLQLGVIVAVRTVSEMSPVDERTVPLYAKRVIIPMFLAWMIHAVQNTGCRFGAAERARNLSAYHVRGGLIDRGYAPRGWRSMVAHSRLGTHASVGLDTKSASRR